MYMSCFPNAVWASANGAFRIGPDALVIYSWFLTWLKKKLAVLYVQLCMLLSNGSFFITVLTEMAWSVLRIMVLTGYVHLLQLNYEDCTNSTVCTAYWDRNCKRIQKRSVERILPPPVLLSFFYYYGSCYAKWTIELDWTIQCRLYVHTRGGPISIFLTQNIGDIDIDILNCSVSSPELLTFLWNSRWRQPPSWIFSFFMNLAIPACW